LEYLEEMDVINEEEKAILEAVRKSKNMNHMPVTQQSRMTKPKGKMPFNNFIPAKSNYLE
jgi:chromosomal replication initiation ATPase DnaA